MKNADYQVLFAMSGFCREYTKDAEIFCITNLRQYASIALSVRMSDDLSAKINEEANDLLRPLLPVSPIVPREATGLVQQISLSIPDLIIRGGGDSRKGAADFARTAAGGSRSLYCGRSGTRPFVGGYTAGY